MYFNTQTKRITSLFSLNYKAILHQKLKMSFSELNFKKEGYTSLASNIKASILDLHDFQLPTKAQNFNKKYTYSFP